MLSILVYSTLIRSYNIIQYLSISYMFPFNQEFSSQRPNAAYVGIGSPACPSHIGEDAALEPLESKGLVRCVCV